MWKWRWRRRRRRCKGAHVLRRLASGLHVALLLGVLRVELRDGLEGLVALGVRLERDRRRVRRDCSLLRRREQCRRCRSTWVEEEVEVVEAVEEVEEEVVVVSGDVKVEGRGRGR